MENNNLTIIRNRLSQTYSGTTNVPTIYHPIDVLTNNEIIVVTELHKWAEGIGLLYAHSTQFPNRTKHLHIYNTHILPRVEPVVPAVQQIVNPLNNLLLNKIIILVNQLNITLSVEE